MIVDLYAEKDDIIYCEACFGQKHSKICMDCEQPITDHEFLRVEEKNFHSDHFKCVQCQKIMKGEKYFHHHENQIICTDCYSPHALTCASCNKKILDYAVTIHGKDYHADCLHCGKCFKKITDQVVQHEKAFFHETCYKQIINPECSICHEYIDQNYLQIEEFVHISFIESSFSLYAPASAFPLGISLSFYFMFSEQKLHIFCYFKMRKVTRAAWRMIKSRKERLLEKPSEPNASKKLGAGGKNDEKLKEKIVDEEALEKISNQLFFKYEELVGPNTPEGVDYRHKEVTSASGLHLSHFDLQTGLSVQRGLRENHWVYEDRVLQSQALETDFDQKREKALCLETWTKISLFFIVLLEAERKLGINARDKVQEIQ